jgi:membrane protein
VPRVPEELERRVERLEERRSMRLTADVLQASARNRITVAAAGLSFHTFLAIVPALIAAVGIARLAGLAPSALASVVHGLGLVFPKEAVALIASALRGSGSRREDLVAAIGGLLVAIWSAIEACAALEQAIEIAFEVPRPRGFVARRIAALPLVGVTIVLAGIAVTLDLFGSSLAHLVLKGLPPVLSLPLAGLVVVVRIAGSLGAIIVLVAIYFQTANRARHGAIVSVGSVAATLGWVLISFGYSLWLDYAGQETRTYGSLAGVAVLLLWLFLSFLVILVGAELDRALGERRLAAEPAHQQGWDGALGVGKQQAEG